MFKNDYLVSTFKFISFTLSSQFTDKRGNTPFWWRSLFITNYKLIYTTLHHSIINNFYEFVRQHSQLTGIIAITKLAYIS